ncbi:MAG: LppX_LprAFG lipoprotein [Thermoflexus sp.]|jgi:hypothetical protein|uniref:LppX_LprAFG lipoprotein n=1 Tax=Thermoflexus sp. TaxID=1969742 RepID=UPI002636D8E9|nr:LppX_LprAFG lipoprotein [Thermoflexus sp.]MDT7884662.1 LppX_LprAFG lipoprotein [Thermoflexus sp.]MDT7948659.1 LppX_LprAFG lipoprotein [Thermoflexus sp.]
MKRGIGQALGLLGWLSLMAITACRPAPPTPALSAPEILQRAARAMAEIQTVHFLLERTGAPDYLDAARTMMLRRVEGDVVRPNGLRGTARVFTLGMVTELGVLRIGERTWVAFPGIGRWEELPPERGTVIDPRLFFDAEQGLPALLARVELRLVGVETLEGRQAFHLHGEVLSGPLEEWSLGLIAGRLRADLWVEARTFRILRVRLMELDSDPQDPTVWQITLSDFNRPIELRPPEGSASP